MQKPWSRIAHAWAPLREGRGQLFYPSASLGFHHMVVKVMDRFVWWRPRLNDLIHVSELLFKMRSVILFPLSRVLLNGGQG